VIPDTPAYNHHRAQRLPWQTNAFARSSQYSKADPSNSASVAGDANGGGGTVCTGMAVSDTSAGTLLYLANFSDGTIDVFDAYGDQVNSFTDPGLPRGYGPFDVEVLDDKLFVTFVHRDAVLYNEFVDPEHGFIAEFSLSGFTLDRAEFRLSRRYRAERKMRARERASKDLQQRRDLRA
jgi:hypothetical protein